MFSGDILKINSNFKSLMQKYFDNYQFEILLRKKNDSF